MDQITSDTIKYTLNFLFTDFWHFVGFLLIVYGFRPLKLFSIVGQQKKNRNQSLKDAAVEEIIFQYKLNDQDAGYLRTWLYSHGRS